MLSKRTKTKGQNSSLSRRYKEIFYQQVLAKRMETSERFALISFTESSLFDPFSGEAACFKIHEGPKLADSRAPKNVPILREFDPLMLSAFCSRIETCTTKRQYVYRSYRNPESLLKAIFREVTLQEITRISFEQVQWRFDSRQNGLDLRGFR